MPTLDWIGKQAVVNHHREVPYHLLKCDAGLSVGDPGSGNLLIQGDNLLALKALLPYYAGRVKCIYIDPPYNTGDENWAYNDAVNSPEIRNWLGKVVGKEAEDLSRHDKWLCMMYPRLSLLKEFLTDDGLIFVSVDENEHCHLALAMGEIFGIRNHLETLIWKKSYGGGAKSKHVVNLHEYVVCYAKCLERIPVLELPPSEKALKYYKFRDARFEARGPYRLQPLATTSMDPRPNLRYPISYQGEEIWPDKQWQWTKERALKALADDELGIVKKKGKWTVSYKQYLRDTSGEERTSKAYSILEGIYNQQGTNEIKAIFGDGKIFSFPKPTALVRHLIQLATGKDSVVLDSFSGSGTTGHAVLDLNKADGGNRRFILVEMEEAICQTVTAQRLKRVIEGYTKPNGERVEGLGGGFRYCRLGPTIFDETGNIRAGVTFGELAAHVYFTETGEPLPKRPSPHPSPLPKGKPPSPRPSPASGRGRTWTPLLGVHNGKAIYLLFNGVLGDRSPRGGNVLTDAVLRALPSPQDPLPKGEGIVTRIIYGEGCRLSKERLKREGIVFKQIPYGIKVT